MKRRRLALLLTLILLASMCACNSSGGAYTTIETLLEGYYAIGFRSEDPAADDVLAALNVLSASGQLHEIDVQWFGKEVAKYPADADALTNRDIPESRTFIMGLDGDNFPMCYRDNAGNFVGYDVDVAQAVCSLLGWELKFQEIGDESDAYVELSSGNVDCVWGGMILDENETMYRVICPYMEADIVVVVLSGNHLGSMRKIEDKTIGMNGAQKYADALATTTLSQTANIKITDAGSEIIFDRLSNGEHDAILIDSAAALYYMR